VPEVYSLENGTMGWQLAGFELEVESPQGVLEPSTESRKAAHTRARALAVEVGVELIEAEELMRWLELRSKGKKNVYVYDVRQVGDYIAAHIGGSTALPGGLAIQRPDDFAPIENAPIVFVDDTETRAL